MSRLILVLLALAGLTSYVRAQIQVDFETGDILPTLSGTIYDGGTCETYEAQGTKGRSSVDLRVTFPTAKDLTKKFIINGEEPELKDVFKPTFTPTFNCETELMSVRGVINSYLITADPNAILRKTLRGNLNFTDYLEVYSPVATTLELPFHASAALAAVQTFCEPGDSRAFARARVTVSLGDATASTGGEVEVKGAFLDNDYPDGTAVAVVNVAPGINRFELQISGELYVESKVKGIGSLITCGSNAVAISGNSLVIDHFTGPEGSALPPGVRIFGLQTGIDYRNLEAGDRCGERSTPLPAVTPASCGQSNGSATLDTTGQNITQVSWSTGQDGVAIDGLAPGDYSAVVTYADSCATVIDFTVTDPSLPVPNLPADTLIGEGQTIVLDASVTTGSFTYSWSTGSEAPTLPVSEPGQYAVTLTDANGCSFPFTVRVVSDRAYFIGAERITVSSGLFYDDGGAGENYRDNRNYVTTLCPDNPDEYLELDFGTVDIVRSDDQDELSIFDGSGSDCPLNASITEPGVYRSSAPGGCLTVRFRSTSYNGTAAGWEATILSQSQPAQPNCFTELGCEETFTDPGGDSAPYAAGDYRVYYLCAPDGQAMELAFDELNIRSSDVLAVYDGRGTECLITTQPRAGDTFLSSGAGGGCLTVVLDAEAGSGPAADGWKATLHCRDPEVTQGGSCRCDNNPAPGNTCSEAPLINNLQAFCGSSSIRYTPDAPGNLEDAFSCGVIHNNSFFRFIPTATSATIQFATDGGNSVLCEGFQLAVFSVEGRCDQPDARWRQLACTNADDGLRSSGSLTVNNLAPGETYYLMIDGSYGSECRYTLNALDGIEVCPVTAGPETTYCRDNSFYVDVPLSGDGSGTEYRVFETEDYYGELDTMVFVDDGTDRTVTLGPYRQGTDYNIAVEGGAGNSACSLRIVGEGPDCATSCAVEADLTLTCLDPLSQTVLVEGTIRGAEAPISVYSSAYQTFILPDEAPYFRDTLVGVAVNDLQFEITDFNYCRIGPEVEAAEICEVDCTTQILHPNPVSTRLEIAGICSATAYRIVDISGRILGSGHLQPGNPFLDVGMLPVGIYHLMLLPGEGQSVLRFVKF